MCDCCPHVQKQGAVHSDDQPQEKDYAVIKPTEPYAHCSASRATLKDVFPGARHATCLGRNHVSLRRMASPWISALTSACEFVTSPYAITGKSGGRASPLTLSAQSLPSQ